MKVLVILLAVLCLAAGGAAVFVLSGSYNIAANDPHWPLTEWFLGVVRERSISAHSKGISIVPAKDSRVLIINLGVSNYHEMCRLCHSAPGYPRSEVARGLYPAPPDFTSKDFKRRKDAEVYWIVKNGIKMTGMAAFGATHSEEELWGIVFFTQLLGGLTPEEYTAMVKAAGLQKKEDHHH
ncbi:MAG: cytochrome c [Deltaproteobacteria bacterium]|nr:cytochrome c [Deltaproteobacteria bacterium]